jgi:seryl-tRNA(Sec) selenium transferase
MSAEGISRRELFRRGGLLGGALAFPELLPSTAAEAAAPPPAKAATVTVPAGVGLRPGPDVYQSIGVRPIVNARGTYTILSGSLMLPEVREAMAAAAQHYVHLDELAEAVGARLATLTGAEWGLVTSGCAAALTHATAACVAGGNPDLHVRIPNLNGFAKDEVIIPKHSRNVYDAALRGVGVRVIEVTTPAELEAAFGPRTALVYILAGPEADESALPTKLITSLAQPRGVPVLVDAAAEILTVPNVHLQNGATLVAYSGGKCLRGPQAAGLLLGRKDLVKAAWVHSPPHHGYSRGYKVGKEEALGMLMAVEMWMKRDHDAEWKTWTSWLEYVGKRVSAVPGVTTTITQPKGLSNRMPSLRVFWPREKMGPGDAVVKTLYDGEPRVAVFPARHDTDPAMTGVTVNPYMMSAGEEKIVADRLCAVLTATPSKNGAFPAGGAESAAAAPPAGDISGQWDVRVEYAAGASNHGLSLHQHGNDIDGVHRGDFTSRDLSGTIDGDMVKLRSSITEQSGDAISYAFTGKVTGDEMAGTLEMGEYLGGKWTARRRAARRG